MSKSIGRVFAWMALGILGILGISNVSAQVVSDGQTNLFDGITTNIFGFTVGNSGPRTALILTNAAVLNNGGSLTIGNQASSSSNLISLNAASSWFNNGNVTVGNQGSANRLEIMDSTLTAVGTYLGSMVSSSSNLVLVSGPTARLTNTSAVFAGYNGAFNRLIVSNGAGLYCSSLSMGLYVTARSNLVLVTGTNSFFDALNDVYLYNKSNVFCVADGAQARLMQMTLRDGAIAIATGAGTLWTNRNFVTLSTGENTMIVSNGATVTAPNVTCGYYSDRNLAVVTGSGSLLSNSQTLAISYAGRSNQFVIANGGKVTANYTHVGENGGSLNLLTVADTGSMLSNSFDCYVGQFGGTNGLIITNGAKVVCYEGVIGLSGNRCSALVTGTNSLWTNTAGLIINSSFGELTVENGAKVYDLTGAIGNSGSNCLATVSGPGAFWTNQMILYVGSNSVGNQLVISNSAAVYARILHVGENVSSSNNLVIIDGGTLTVTNPINGGGLMDVRRGTLLLRSGLADIDKLQLNTGSQSQATILGGRLRSRQILAGNGVPFVVGGGATTGSLELLTGGPSHQFPSGLVIATNGLLTGYATSSGNLLVGAGGVVTPYRTNQSFSSMTFSSITMSNGALPTLKLDPDRGSDFLVANGSMTFGGTLQIIRTNPVVTANNFSAGNSFRLFVAGSYTGQFNAIIPATPGPGLKWNTNQLLVDGTLRVVSVVPPSPEIIAVATTATNISLSVRGGIAYDPCYLLSTTNFLLPFSLWDRWATNYYDESGSVALTNTVGNQGFQRYFVVEAH
jgi:T5SS/PEP-CTERM-associated repeat protein